MTGTVMPGREAEAPGVVSDAILGRILLISAGLGFVAAFALTVEKFILLSNPFYQPSCSVNEQFSCTSVMTSPQSEVFGFPNPLLGIAGFAVVAATGALLTGGLRPPRWYWLALQGGAIFGIAFTHWLTWQSITSIGALCPYCMVVWAAMIVIFCYVTFTTLTRYVSRGTPQRIRQLVDYHSAIAIGWILVVMAVAVLTTL